jgi:hypothetical protein
VDSALLAFFVFVAIACVMLGVAILVLALDDPSDKEDDLE